MDSDWVEIEGIEWQKMEVERQAIPLLFLINLRKNRTCLDCRKNT
jgi:hypothetical protein